MYEQERAAAKCLHGRPLRATCRKCDGREPVTVELDCYVESQGDLEGLLKEFADLGLTAEPLPVVDPYTTIRVAGSYPTIRGWMDQNGFEFQDGYVWIEVPVR